jgi:hypothetical protein
MAKSVKKSAAGKRAFARAGGGKSDKGKATFVKLIKDGTLCKRRRTLGGGYKRASSCKPSERVTSSADPRGRGTHTPKGGDSILNPLRSRKISAARKKAATYRRKKKAA